MVVAGEDDVRLEPLNGFVAESAGREDDGEMADEDASEAGVLLHLRDVLVGQQRHLVDDPIDVVNVEIILELPLAAVLEVVVEALHLRRLHHLRPVAADVVVARQVNHLDILDQRKDVHEAREVSLVFEVVGEGRFVWKFIKFLMLHMDGRRSRTYQLSRLRISQRRASRD